MEILWDVLSFGAKALLLVLAFLSVAVVFANLAFRFRPPREQLEVENLNDRLKAFSEALTDAALEPKALKKVLKARKKLAKSEDNGDAKRGRVFVLDFDGDLRASAVEHFRDEISAILSAAKIGEDEVVVRLESPGGMVQAYGLAAAQLMRVRNAGLKLTICVDQVAASGGYLMACTADQILAAPFAVVGSIGVIAQVPNLHRFLKKHDVDYEEITAGEFKRTISLFGEISEKGRRKFVEQIEGVHALFKNYVQSLRPKLHMSDVATGEHWFGQRALELGLIDKIQSSDEYLFEKIQKEDAQVLLVRIQIRKPLSERFAITAAKLWGRSLDAVVERSASQVKI